jgi:hypothetical protein
MAFSQNPSPQEIQYRAYARQEAHAIEDRHDAPHHDKLGADLLGGLSPRAQDVRPRGQKDGKPQPPKIGNYSHFYLRDI